jgi:anti-sigma regulatory factor (Ser/Thr protein kinase)
VEKRVPLRDLVREILLAAAIAETALQVAADLPPDASSVRSARTLVRDALGDVGAETLFSLELLVSEVVTNAVSHADPPVTLRVHVDDQRTRVEVTDGVRDVPVVRDPPPTALGGRGVMFVDRLASSWGTSDDHDGDAAKTVWFELRHDDVTELGHFTTER